MLGSSMNDLQNHRKTLVTLSHQYYSQVQLKPHQYGNTIPEIREVLSKEFAELRKHELPDREMLLRAFICSSTRMAALTRLNGPRP